MEPRRVPIAPSLRYRLPNPPRLWLERPALLDALSARQEDTHVRLQGPAGAGKTALLTRALDPAMTLYVDARAEPVWWRGVVRALHERAGTAPMWSHINASSWLAHALDLADRLDVTVALDHMEEMEVAERDAVLEALARYPRTARWWTLTRGPALAMWGDPLEVPVPAPDDATLARWIARVDPHAPETWLSQALSTAQGNWTSLATLQRERATRAWLEALPQEQRDVLQALAAGHPAPASERAIGALTRAGLLERTPQGLALADSVRDKIIPPQLPNATSSHSGLAALERALDTGALDDALALLEAEGATMFSAGWAPEIWELLERAPHPKLDVWRLHAARDAYDPQGPRAASPPTQETPQAWMAWADHEAERQEYVSARGAIARARALGPADGSDILEAMSHAAEGDWVRAQEVLTAPGSSPWRQGFAALCAKWRGEHARALEEAQSLYGVLRARPAQPRDPEDFGARVECARVLHLCGEIRQAREILESAGEAPDDLGAFSSYREGTVAFLRALIDASALEIASASRVLGDLLARISPASALGLHARNVLLFQALRCGASDAEVADLLGAQRRALDLVSDSVFEAQWARCELRFRLRTTSWLDVHVHAQRSSAPMIDESVRRALEEQRWRRGEPTKTQPEDETHLTLRALHELAVGDGPGSCIDAMLAEMEDMERRGHASGLVTGLDVLWRLWLAHGEVSRAWGVLERLAAWEARGVRVPGALAVHTWLAEKPEPLALFGEEVREARLMLGRESPDRLEAMILETLWGELGWRVSGATEPVFWVDPGRRQMFDVSGEVVTWRAGNRSFGCLVALLGRPDGVASKEALLREVWGIEEHHPLEHENRLRMAMFKLRKRLEEAGWPADAWVETTDEGYAVRRGALIER